MAEEIKKDFFDFKKAVKELNTNGPERIYYLYGVETYLRDLFIEELKKVVIPDGDNGFCLIKFDDAAPDIEDIDKAVNSMPFMSDRTYVELKNIDINRYKDSDALISVLSDVPDYCTVVIVLDPLNEPDMRLKVNKRLKETARCYHFEIQSEKALITWIMKRFKAEHKTISAENAEKLIFVSGDNMNTLIPEIGKVAAYAQEDEISESDILSAAHHLPGADVFEMADKLASAKYAEAAKILSDLIYSGIEAPLILSLMASQYKRLFAAKIAKKYVLGPSFLVKNNISRFSSLASSQYNMAARIPLTALQNILNLCGEADYRMKNSADDSDSILKEVFARIVLEVRNDKA